MTEPPVAPTPPEPDGMREIPKGAGCVIGGVSIVIAIVATAFVAAATGVLGAVAGVLAIAALAYGAMRVPGFLMGVGLTVAIGVVLFGACLAMISSG